VTGAETLLLGAFLLAALLQGLSGLGFGLLAAPIATQIIPGSASIGFINLLALAQNLYQIIFERAPIAWHILRSLTPPLLAGIAIGLTASQLLPESLRPIVVSLSSLGALIILLVWKPQPNRTAANLSGLWSGSINAYAGNGGPPLAIYLIRTGIPHDQAVRTLQVAFATTNAISIPFLGLPHINPTFLLFSITAIAVGTIAGIRLRRLIPTRRARLLTIIVIALASSITLVTSLLALA